MYMEGWLMIVVTGGAGFIGSNLLADLQAAGHCELVVCDPFGPGERWQNLVRRRLAAFLEPKDLLAFLDHHQLEIAIVFHLGAISTTTETNAVALLQQNFTFSCQLWDWCTDHGIRIVYASSAATYGNGAHGFDDDMADQYLGRLRPLNAYAWSKHLFDRWVSCRVQARRVPPQWVGLKLFNVYGPNEYHKGHQQSMVAQAFCSLRTEGKIRLFRSTLPSVPDGDQTRDFVWVGDCTNIMLWLLDHSEVSGLFNVGTGRARKYNDLARLVVNAAGLCGTIEYIDMPEALRGRYQNLTEARLDRLRSAGYTSPFTQLEEGITAYVQRFLLSDDPYR